MIRLSRWQTFFIGFGIIVALLVGERLLFLNKALTLQVSGGHVSVMQARGGTSRIEFIYNNQTYVFTSYGFSSLAESNGTLLIDPDNPDKVCINTPAEIWVPRIIGHVIALIIWYMVVSSFITNREYVRLGLKGISREKKQPPKEPETSDWKQLDGKK